MGRSNEQFRILVHAHGRGAERHGDASLDAISNREGRAPTKYDSMLCRCASAALQELKTALLQQRGECGGTCDEGVATRLND